MGAAYGVVVTEKMLGFSVTMAENCRISNKTAIVTEEMHCFSVTMY